jgi:hypothetical protein
MLILKAQAFIKKHLSLYRAKHMLVKMLAYLPVAQVRI